MPWFKNVIDNLKSEGIATVVSSGNDNYTDAMRAPACISSAVSVGSTTKSDDLSSFSNSASFLSLLAPGSGISSSVPGGGFESKSGTSQAAPHVAGALALLKQKYPEASVHSILSSLVGTGTLVKDTRSSLEYPTGTGITKPRINIADAAATLTRAFRSTYAISDSTRDCSGAEEGQPPWLKFFYLPDAGGCIAEGAEGNSYGLLVNDLNKVVFHADTGERLGVAKDLDPDLFRGANSVTHQEFCEALEAIPDQAMTPQSYLKQYANVKERLILDPNRDGIACTAKDSRAKIGRFLKGKPGNDDLKGTSGNDIIYGRGGDDTIRGLGGSDLIRGGAGNDTIYGGAGNDTIYGGPGTDRLFGGPGRDRLFGQGGNDRLVGGGGPDRLIGGPGVDRLFGQRGNDFLNVRDKKPRDLANGGAGNDRCVADRGDRRVRCER